MDSHFNLSSFRMAFLDKICGFDIVSILDCPTQNKRNDSPNQQLSNNVTKRHHTLIARKMKISGIYRKLIRIISQMWLPRIHSKIFAMG